MKQNKNQHLKYNPQFDMFLPKHEYTHWCTADKLCNVSFSFYIKTSIIYKDKRRHIHLYRKRKFNLRSGQLVISLEMHTELYMVVTGHMWLFIFKLIKSDEPKLPFPSYTSYVSSLIATYG